MLMSPKPHAHRGRPPLASAVRVAVVGVLLSVLVIPCVTRAGPTGGQVVAGSGTIQRPDASTTLIQQQSQSLAVDWSGFDIASHELVQFQQPSSSAAALNRVFNELPSQVLGRIQANGQVFIMNPNGVVFGPGSRVEVGALVASSLDIHVEDFMSGHYQFAAPHGSEPGLVVNRGLIKAATGGGVTLLGGAVRNDGVIVADLGHVLMGAGRQALVDFDGDGLIRFHVDGAILQDVAGDGSAVSNTGEIQADGGQVLLSAAVARGIFDRAVNNEGIIRAASIDRSAGAVRLSATGGMVENSGTVDVSASQTGSAGSVVLNSDTEVLQRGQIRADADQGDAGQVVLESAGLTLLDTGGEISARASAGRGGSVQALGESVAMLDAATIDVSGGSGGGTVLVGGDYQGANPSVANARITGIAAGAQIRADATDLGDGGRVIVWSDETTNFFGSISARGGPSGGDGGFAEVSGKEHLSFRGSADLRASRGSRGTLLLDPAFLTIVGGPPMDGDGDGSPWTFSGTGADSAAGQILFSDQGPNIVYESEIEAQSEFSDISLEATIYISTSGSFADGDLALAENSNLLIEVRNEDAGFFGVIDLTRRTEDTDLSIVTSGTGTITVRAGIESNGIAQISLPNLISDSDIRIATGGGASSSVVIVETLSGANVGIDTNGSITVGSDGRVIANGVSLKAGADIGSDSAPIEIVGVTDLLVDVGEGDFFISGANGAGGAGQALSSLSLSLEPNDDGEYVVENFNGQIFDFTRDGFGDEFVIREITSATPLELNITTLDEGIFIGGVGGAGIQLAGASNVTLDSDDGIDEAVFDDGMQVVAEITTDGRVTLVAKKDIGGNGLLDIAAGSGGVSTLQAVSDEGAVRVNGLGALRVEGSGIGAAGGGGLVAGNSLTIAADVVSNADMSFTASNDADQPGNDVRVVEGAVVKLDSNTPATLRFNAGDNIAFDDGRVETIGSRAHRVELHADLENGGSDGAIGRVSQTGVAASVTGGQLSVVAGGGAALQTQISALSVDNTTTGDVRIDNQGDVDVVDSFRNQSQGGALTLISDDGAIDTGTADVASNAGLVTLEARESNSASLAHVIVGASGIRSANADAVIRAADDISLGGPVDTGAGELSLNAGAAIQQLAGRIAAASLRSESGGDTTLTGSGNAIDRYSANTADGNVRLSNGVDLALADSDVGGDLQIDNAQALGIAGSVRVKDRATLTTAAGNIDGAGGRIEAAELSLDSGGSIGIGEALDWGIEGDIFLRSRGTGSDGDIRIEEDNDFATSQLQLLATDAASAQKVSLNAGGVLTVDKDLVAGSDLGPGDRLELGATRIDLAEKISADGVDVNFKAPVEVIGNSVWINLNEGLLTFEENVSPGSDTTLTLKSEVIFASGQVTGRPDSSLVIEGALNLATDTTIVVDNLRLSGNPASLTGDGDLTILPATHGRDIVIGGRDGLAPDITLATLQGFGGGRELSIGVPLLPTTTFPFAGNVRVEEALSVGDAVLTVGGLGDVTLDNHDNPLASDRAVNIVAIGDRQVFPGLVDHDGGNILDTDDSAGAPATLEAPVVSVIAQGLVGSSANALEIEVGSGGSANFVTGATNAFINTIPANESVNNVVDTSVVLAAFQAQGFFQDPLSQGAQARTVGLETTGLETTGLGELLFIDDGVFLLPVPYTTPVQATLLPTLMDPDFPAHRRPDDADDEQAWQAFYTGVLKDYVQSRYLLSDDAPELERAAVDARIESEWQSLVAYFQGIRAREQAAMTTGTTTIGSGG